VLIAHNRLQKKLSHRSQASLTVDFSATLTVRDPREIGPAHFAVVHFFTSSNRCKRHIVISVTIFIKSKDLYTIHFAGLRSIMINHEDQDCGLS